MTTETEELHFLSLFPPLWAFLGYVSPSPNFMRARRAAENSGAGRGSYVGIGQSPSAGPGSGVFPGFVFPVAAISAQ